MKKLLLFTLAVLILITTIFTGCVSVNLAEENGPLKTQTYDFTDFTGIDVGHAFKLKVTPSDNYSVSVTAGTNVLEHINVYKHGSTLVFEVDGWTNIWFSSWYSSPRVEITMPVLTELKLSGAVKADVSGFKSANDFNLVLSGASEIDMDMETGNFITEISGASHVDGRLTATSSDIGLSGASSIRLIGSGGDIRIHGSGASDADLKNYAAHNADIDCSGASHVSLSISGRMNVSLSGASSLEYAGHPTLGVMDLSGASSMEQIVVPADTH